MEDKNSNNIYKNFIHSSIHWLPVATYIFGIILLILISFAIGDIWRTVGEIEEALNSISN
jgi:hypothetical protein